MMIILFLAGFSEDSDYTSDVNLPANGQIPNASSSQYLPAALTSSRSPRLQRGEEPDPFFYDTGQGHTVCIGPFLVLALDVEKMLFSVQGKHPRSELTLTATTNRVVSIGPLRPHPGKFTIILP